MKLKQLVALPVLLMAFIAGCDTGQQEPVPGEEIPQTAPDQGMEPTPETTPQQQQPAPGTEPGGTQ